MTNGWLPALAAVLVGSVDSAERSHFLGGPILVALGSNRETVRVAARYRQRVCPANASYMPSEAQSASGVSSP